MLLIEDLQKRVERRTKPLRFWLMLFMNLTRAIRAFQEGANVAKERRSLQTVVSQAILRQTTADTRQIICRLVGLRRPAIQPVGKLFAVGFFVDYTAQQLKHGLDANEVQYIWNAVCDRWCAAGTESMAFEFKVQFIAFTIHEWCLSDLCNNINMSRHNLSFGIYYPTPDISRSFRQLTIATNLVTAFSPSAVQLIARCFKVFIGGSHARQCERVAYQMANPS